MVEGAYLMDKILITGATGFTGQNLCQRLVGAGEQFTRITIQFDAGLGVRALA